MKTLIEIPANPLASVAKPEGITWGELGLLFGIAFPLISGIVTVTVVISTIRAQINELKAELKGEFKVVNTRLEGVEKGQCERDATISDLKTQAACNKGNIEALRTQLNDYGINVHTRNTR